jgi:glycosyltransferase involved in cell wall biosynthesis
MNINIVFPYNTWSGAHRSTYELSNRMAARGHDVKIYFPFFPYRNRANPVSVEGISTVGRGLIRSSVRRNRVPWFELNVPVKVIPTITNRFVRDADVILANHWQTAESVARLAPSKGRKFNFVRDHSEDERIIRSLRLPLRQIVSIPWLKDCLEREIGVDVCGIVANGLNMDEFGVEEKRHNDPPVLTMCYNPGDPRKGVEDGLAALERIKAKYPQVEIHLFGWRQPPDLGLDAKFHHRPVKDRLRAVYAGTDIFLAPSRAEGYHNPPREAMAAQCAVVATNVGSIPHCAIPGKTAIVVEPRDVDAMVEGISRLIENTDERREMGANAYQHIKQFDWEESASELLRVFEAST